MTTWYSILTLNWNITDSVRPLIMAVWKFLMVIRCWIILYFKKLEMTHPSFSLPLSFSWHLKLYHLPLVECIIEKNVQLTYLLLDLWMYLLFDSFLSFIWLLMLWLLLLHREGLCEFISDLSSSAFSVAHITNASPSEGLFFSLEKTSCQRSLHLSLTLLIQ